jgi:ABC-type multidrug transport system fused ATPase/permease subunit
MLMSGTIRQILAFYDESAMNREEELRNALRIACAEFVESLPEGLDAACGEQGGGLSEGQAQRIAIARSLLREGSILLLDEATSALDPDTEQRFLQGIASELQGKTLIFITHRPSVLEYCSRVLHV